MMKSIIKKGLYLFIVGLAFLCIVVSSCAEDEGNYEYTETKEISVSLDDQYVVEQFENLVISPVFNKQVSLNTSEYSYLWYVWKSESSIPDTICREQNINTPIKYSPGKYYMCFEIQNKDGVVVSLNLANLSVVNSNSNGLAVLSNVDGEAEITFISKKGKITKEIYNSVNGERAGSSPVCLVYMGSEGYVIPTIGIGCSSGSIIASTSDFQFLSMLKDQIYFPPEKCVLQALKRDLSEMYEYAIIDGGIYSRNIMYSSSPNSMFDTRVGGNDYELSPFIIEASGSSPTIFDRKSGRFMWDYYGDLLPVGIPETTTLFNPLNVNGDLIYATSFKAEGDNMLSRYENIRGVIRLNNGSLFAFGALMVEGYDANWNRVHTLTPSHRMDIPAEATSFGCSSIDPNFIFYSVGNVIFCKSIATGNIISQIDLGQKIDYMEFDRMDPSILYVGISNSSSKSDSGSVVSMTMSSDGKLSENVRYQNVCGKVVDFETK